MMQNVHKKFKIKTYLASLSVFNVERFSIPIVYFDLQKLGLI
jgi:hypothetical protein